MGGEHIRSVWLVSTWTRCASRSVSARSPVELPVRDTRMAGNEAAIRAHGKVGFRRVGAMRLYERGQIGTWHDGLLMEMLADELTRETELGWRCPRINAREG
jgi:hypothetical protein